MINSTEYPQWITVDTMVGQVPVELVTRPGYPSWGHVTQAQSLLAANAFIEPGERVLVGSCGHGALGVWAAEHTAPDLVTVLDTHWAATEAARRTLDANDCAAVRVETFLPRAAPTPYDVALVTLPKGRHLTRAWLYACFQALVPGGRLYLAGANRAGIKSALKDCAALYGQGQVLGYKGGNRVVLYDRPTAAPQPLPNGYGLKGIAEGTFHTYTLRQGDDDLTICTRPGVFSWQRLDKGSEMLLDQLTVNPTDTVLDVGCGCGVLGLVAARGAYEGQATLIDIDALACECATATCSRNGASNTRVVLGDGLVSLPDARYSLIISNPPFHSGHEVDLEMVRHLIRDAWQALERRGRLLIVANRFLPYDDLMRERFGQVQVLGRTSQYHVLQATKRRHPSRADGSSRRSPTDSRG